MNFYEVLFAKKINGGGGGGSVQPLSVTANGTYTAESGGYSPVTVNVGDFDYENLKEVALIDYDGTLLHNYTAEEFLALDSLPANPSHTGLVAQGWNWTLAEAKTFVQTYGCLCIGQNYKTDDASTRLYYSVDSDILGYETKLIVDIVSGSVTIDWGDGSATTTTSGTGNKTVKHTYASTGDYIIKITLNSGTYKLGNSMMSGSFTDDYYFSGMGLKKVEVGEGCVAIHKNAFTNLFNVETISIPTDLVTFGDSNGSDVFSTTKIKAIVFPPSANYYGNSNLSATCIFASMHNVTLQSQSYVALGLGSKLAMLTGVFNYGPQVGGNGGVINLRYLAAGGSYTKVAGNYGVTKAFKLKRAVIPSSVTEISDYAFQNSRGVYHLLPSSVPSLANTRAFTGALKIYVPYSADHSILTAYKTATNWLSYASIMEEEPQ